jgi:hypothetical protein
MKVRMFEVEGSPEELSALPELRQALLAVGPSEPNPRGLRDTPPEESPNGFGMSDELRDFIAQRAGNPRRAATVQRWVDEVLSWGTEPVLGHSRNSSDGLGNYLMLYAGGPRRFGAFAYVRPGNGNVKLRLDAAAAKGFQHAHVRNVQSDNSYQVIVTLNTDDAYQEALKLAEKALREVQE